MNQRLLQLLLGIALLSVTNVDLYAQSRRVKGKISDENGNGLPGASILVKNSSKGVATDAGGNFSIEVSSSSDVLVISA